MSCGVNLIVNGDGMIEAFLCKLVVTGLSLISGKKQELL